MVCSFCAQGLVELFEELKPVQSVVVDMETKTVQLIIKEKEQISEDDIRKTVDYAGYTVRGIRN